MADQTGEDIVKVKLSELQENVSKRLMDLFDGLQTVYENDGEAIVHIDSDKLGDATNGLKEIISVATYLAFAFGHEIGASNDKHRVEAIFRKIEESLPPRPTKEQIYKEIVADQGTPSNKALEQEYRLAAFNRGYDTAKRSLQETIQNIIEYVAGCSEIEVMVATQDAIEKLPEDVREKLRQVFKPKEIAAGLENKARDVLRSTRS